MQYLGYKSEPQKVCSTVEKVRKKSQKTGCQAAQTFKFTLYSKIVYLHRLLPKKLFFCKQFTHLMVCLGVIAEGEGHSIPHFRRVHHLVNIRSIKCKMLAGIKLRTIGLSS